MEVCNGVHIKMQMPVDRNQKEVEDAFRAMHWIAFLVAVGQTVTVLLSSFGPEVYLKFGVSDALSRCVFYCAGALRRSERLKFLGYGLEITGVGAGVVASGLARLAGLSLMAAGIAVLLIQGFQRHRKDD